MVDKSWAVALTTAPREGCTLARCVESLRACGWEPTIFAEPGSTSLDCQTFWNDRRQGAWHNFLGSVRWAVATGAEVILTVQDDSLFHPDSKIFVESILWPSDKTGFVSLYTPQHYSIGKVVTELRPTGVNRLRVHSLWGACALVWPRDVLAKFLSHPIATNWIGAKPRSRRSSVFEERRKNPHLIANVDTAIGSFMNEVNLEMYFVDPSAVQHIAKHSTIGHGDNTGKRNALRIADHGIPLAKQVLA